MAQPKLIAKRPSAASQLREWEFPSFSRTRLSSGFQIIVANTPGRTLAAAELLLDAGAANESAQEGGVAAIAAKSLTEGTRNHKGPAFVQSLEALGGDIEGSAGWDSFSLDLRVPVARLEPALELLAEAVLHPQFPWGEVDRLIQQRVASIFQEYANASTRASIAFDKLVYTPTSPYSRPAEGAYGTMSVLGKRRVKKYYEHFCAPSSATLILVGDLEGFPAEKIADKLFGDWKSKPPQLANPGVRQNIDHTAVLLVNRPDSEQSQIQVGHVGAPRSTPDYFPILVMSGVLGGLFDSRLNRSLREEKGYTYAANAGFSFRRHAGPFRAATAVDTDVTAPAVAEILNVIRKMHDEGITKEEMEDVKGFLTGIFTLRFETPEAIASALSELVTFDLPDDYYSTYRANVEGVTLEEANRAAQEYLHPDQLGVVVVGDAKKVRDPILAEQFGPVALIEDPEPGEPPTD